LDYWIPKLARNQARHECNAAQLRELGWYPLVIWECERRARTTVSANEWNGSGAFQSPEVRQCIRDGLEDGRGYGVPDDLIARGEAVRLREFQIAKPLQSSCLTVGNPAGRRIARENPLISVNTSQGRANGMEGRVPAPGDYGSATFVPPSVAISRKIVPVEGLGIKLTIRPLREISDGIANSGAQRKVREVARLYPMRRLWKLIPHPEIRSNPDKEKPPSFLRYPELPRI
jgi:hypothetical protein